MKMKCLLLVLSFFYCSSAFAEYLSYVATTVDYSHEYIDGGVAYNYFSNSMQYIGYEKDVTSTTIWTEHHYRTLYRVAIPSIPANAYEITAILTARQNWPSYDGKITRVRDDVSTSNLADIYSAIEFGSIIGPLKSGADVVYNISQYVINNRNIGYLYLGAHSTHETDGLTTVYLSIELTYKLPVSITIKNNPNFGKVIVNGVEQNSGYVLSARNGTNLTIEGKTQTTEYNGYNYVWNDYATNNKSNWIKTGVTNPVATTKSYTFTVDGSATYEAMLRKNYKITRTDKTEFDGDLANQATIYVVEGNSGTMTAPATKAYNSKTYNFAGWLGTSGSNFTPTSNMTLTALYKIPGKTNNTAAFEHNGQKKASRGYLTYESIGRVWLEYNSSIVTGKPLDALEAKNPSLDNYYINYTANGHTNCVLVTYQEKQIDGTYKIKLDKISSDGTKLFSADVYDSPNLYTRDASPLVVVGHTTDGIKITVVWKEYTNGSTPGGLYYLGGKDMGTSIQWNYIPQKLSTTSDNSINPSMDAEDFDIDQTGYIAYLAWEENNNIYYGTLGYGMSGISAGGAGCISNDHWMFENNHFKPSVIVSGGIARIGWMAGEEGNGAILMKSKVIYGSWTGGYWESIDTFLPASLNLNKFHSDIAHNEYTMVFSFEEWFNKLYSSRKGFIEIPTHLKYLQLSFEEGAYSYYSYNHASLPVTFSNWSWDDDPFDKESIVATKNDPIHFKSISFVQDGVRSSLQIGNLKLGDEMLKFKDSGLDTIKSEFKEVLSEAFAVNENSPVSFTLINRNKNLDEFKRDNYLKYSVEVVDANTNKTIKKVKEINVSKDKAVSEKINYTLDMKGVSASKIRIKLSAESNSPESMYVTDTYYANRVDTDAENAAVAMQEEVPAQYGLMQNYPNPFNPSTVISYDIPEASRVTLKVYDILGREVADLVNEFKEAGRYNVKFDASHLSTGIYIYQLRANDYVSVKKMSFVK